MKKRCGFTLIELLIVVAIIAILAAIAVPNFLEAQIRAKVGRAESDMRTIATGLEAYAVDYHKYPPNSPDGMGIIPPNLSTPVSYLTSADLIDPFTASLTKSSRNLTRQYTYTGIVTLSEAISLTTAGIPPPDEAVDHPAYNRGAFRKYGKWRMLSHGPDRKYIDKDHFPRILYGSDVSYDSTNGSRSFGNIFRLQNGRPFPPL